MSKSRNARATRGARRAVAQHRSVLPLLSLALAGALLVGCEPGDPLVEIRKMHAEGRYEPSIEPLRELLEERKDDPEVNYLYGLALTRIGEPSLALFALRKAMEDPAWRVEAALEVGAGALYTQNQDGAIAAANQALEVEPDNVDALLLRARAKIASRRDYEGALADADRILEIEPEHAAGSLQRAIALLSLQRVEEAQKAIEALGEGAVEEQMKLDETGFLCAVLAMFTFEKGEVEAASKRFADCAERFPDKREVVAAVVEVYDGQKRQDDSLEVIRKAVAAEPASLEFRTALAQRLRTAGQPDEAEKVLREGTELPGRDMQRAVWIVLADHLLAVDKPQEAVEAFDKALELSDDTPSELLFMYADTLLLAERYDDAFELADRMTVPAHAGLVRGRVYLARGELDQALEKLTEAITTWPDNAVARYYTALTAEALGDFDRALVEFRAAVRADETGTDARERLARMHLARGEDSLALTISLEDPRKDLTPSLACLHLEAAARLHDAPTIRRILIYFKDRVGKDRPEWGQAIAAVARGAREKDGPKRASQYLLGLKEFDLTLPVNAPALLDLTGYLLEQDRQKEALTHVEAALAAHPNSALAQVALGRVLEVVEPDGARAKQAYEQALALDPRSAKAEAALARLAEAAGNTAAAREGYVRAAALSKDPEIVLPTARLLEANGQRDEAEALLVAALEEHPYEGQVALQLATLALSSDGPTPRVLGLARRAVRFGGGSEADALLERVEKAKATAAAGAAAAS